MVQANEKEASSHNIMTKKGINTNGKTQQKTKKKKNKREESYSIVEKRGNGVIRKLGDNVI